MRLLTTPLNYLLRKLKFTHFLYCHVLLLAGLLTYGVEVAFLVSFLSTALVLFPLGSLIVHQHFNHNYAEFKNKFTEWFSLILLVAYSYWPLREMKSYHISHHRTWLTPSDPTASEIAQGKWLYYLGLTTPQHFERYDVTIAPSFEFVAKYFFRIKLAIYALLVLLFGIEGLFYIVIVPQFFMYVLAKGHDLIFHSSPDAQDCPWLFPVYFNDCWHIEHHAHYDEQQAWHWPWVNLHYWYHRLLFS